jgi:hypothetical protein
MVRLLLRLVRFGTRVVVDGVDGMLVRMQSNINGTMVGVAADHHATSASL